MNIEDKLRSMGIALHSYLDKLSKDPETIKTLKSLGYFVQNYERTSPFMKKALLEMQSNSNLSESLKTVSYSQLFHLLANSNQIEHVSILDIINENIFQRDLLNFFEIEMGNNFKQRKNIIIEAFYLYKLELYAGCLCLLHSQLEGIITDYLLHKKIIKERTNANGKVLLEEVDTLKGKCSVTGLAKKIELAKKINKNFSRLESFNFDNNESVKFSNERNDVLHGSNISNFNRERCFIVFIWIDSLLSSIYNSNV